MHTSREPALPRSRRIEVSGAGARCILLCLSMVAWAGSTRAQQLPEPPPKPNPVDLPLDSSLWDASERWRRTPGSKDSLRAELERRDFVFDAEGRIHLDIARPAELNTPLEGLLSAHAGHIDTQAPGRADAWIPVEKLVELARAMPEGNFIYPGRPLRTNDVTGEGPAVTNSISYANGGADGGGITIGIIDGGFTGLTASRNNGDSPIAFTTLINYTPQPFESSSPHGTGCVESAFDHAPGASYRLYRIDSVSDLVSAINNGIAAGVDIFSLSSSLYNEGWGDNTGPSRGALISAGANGILFFTSAGNRQQSHHQGTFADSDGDGWCEFSGTTDETISVTTSPNPGDVNLYLSWDTSAGTTDYDLYLWNAAGTSVLVSSTNSGNAYESLSWDNPSSGSAVVGIAVYKRSGPGAEFEIFDHNGAIWNEHITTASSIAPPSTTTSANVIAVAAVDQSNFGAGNGSNVIMSYSSLGPTNDGRLKPDFTGPTNTSGFTYSSFGGTSSSTPNVAGAAAAFWSSDLQLDAAAVRWLLFEQGDVFRDWGVSGKDNVYGEGGIQLIDHQPNTVWLDRNFGNSTNLRRWPFYTLQAAEDNVVWGGRVLMINAANYPETATLDNNFTLEVIGGTKTLGN